jgi:outer membrane scaffolding protein for murein synthesis (MipA/OmpV family)
VLKYLVTLFSVSVFSIDLPRVELGLATATFKTPHYPSSSQDRARSATIPIIIYRGDYLISDDDGIRSELADTNNYNFNLSFGVSFPADNSDNKARIGMPDIDWIFELGPAFEYFFQRKEDRQFSLRTGLRGAVTTDFGFTKYLGHVIHPILSYRKFFDDMKARISFRAGSIWANEGVQDNIFEIREKYTTNKRKRFNAKSGILESHIDMSFTYQFSNRFRMFSFIQRNFYNNPNNESFLYEVNEATSMGIGFIWMFYVSDTMVQRR